MNRRPEDYARHPEWVQKEAERIHQAARARRNVHIGLLLFALAAIGAAGVLWSQA